jgi:hypothetical protein
MSEKVMLCLGVAAVSIGAILVVMLFFIPIPQENKSLVDVSLGLVLGWGGAVIQFYFGSSKGSADKTVAMNETAKRLAEVEPKKVE